MSYQYLSFGRKELQKLVFKAYSIDLSNLLATEGIIHCRGERLENSSYFDKEKLFMWLQRKIPTIQYWQHRQEQEQEEL